MIHKTLSERICGKFIEGAPDECWIWTASTDNHGYGQIYDNAIRAPRKAYKVLYELRVGPVPKGLQLDHLCRNRLCVNPAHLEPVTQAENIRRGNARNIVVLRTQKCIRGHSFEERTSNGKGKTRCAICRRERRASR